MNESYVTTKFGAVNEDSYASIIKVGHPSSAVVILKHECSVLIYDAHALSHNSLKLREAISDLDERECVNTFLYMVGYCAKAVHHDPVFRNQDPKKVGRVVAPVFSKPVDRDVLSLFAQGSFNGYQSYVTPPSKHLKPKYYK